MIDLSVLICSVHTRYKTFAPRIQTQVFDQYSELEPEQQARIEILILTDNKKRMLGRKRNDMVDLAQGRYVQFIDDDDRIHPKMFAWILDAITSHNPDTITFKASVTLNNGRPKLCRYSLDYPSDHDTPELYERIPNHICVVRRDLATQVDFPQLSYREDVGYATALRPLLKTEHHIPAVLYHYDYNDATTETQHQLPAVTRRLARRTPVADIVMLSDAQTPALRTMTQHAIDTAIIGAHHPVNVIVLEQTGYAYTNATTLPAAGPFHFNRHANAGAGRGTAPWLVIANNDLIFEDNWLTPLLAAEHPVVSPKNPADPRQQHITSNTAGTVNGTHLSGWCFMIRRDIWYAIGGFDEDFALWCADDALIEQLKPHNIAPMLVPDSRVNHLVSATLRRLDDDGELTWGQVQRFNSKYGANKFADDPRYTAWQQRKTVRA